MNPPDWAALVPEVTLRPQQLDALNQVFEHFWVHNRKVVLLEAPTGVGKSIIQIALARYAFSVYHDRSFMVTPQRILQDQMKGWTDLAIMKGKNSYPCVLLPEATARTAPCNLTDAVREENPTKCGVGSCPFYTALSAAKASPTVMHNYSSLLAQSHISAHFEPRGLICLDEGHTAVSWIRNYLSCEFTPNDLLSLTTENPPRKLEFFLPWLRWVLSGILDSSTAEKEEKTRFTDEMSINILKMKAHSGGFGIYARSELHDMYVDADTEMSFEAWAKRFLMSEDAAQVPWITEWNEPTRFKPEGWWSITPVKVAPMASALTKLGRKVLIVTATVLRKNLFAAELGLGKEDIGEVIIDSAFHKDNRPIIKMYAGSMSYGKQEATLPKLFNKLSRIADMHHPDEPGIIHTVSHHLAATVTEALRERLPHRSVEQLPQGSDREAVIEAFLSAQYGPNAILVGPGLLEGLDGLDGSLRWQCLVKVPWPSWTDPVITHLRTNLEAKWFNAWYNWKTAQQTVQGVGRVVRTPTDYGTTYLLDSGFERIFKPDVVPRYVLDALVEKS